MASGTLELSVQAIIWERCIFRISSLA